MNQINYIIVFISTLKYITASPHNIPPVLHYGYGYEQPEVCFYKYQHTRVNCGDSAERRSDVGGQECLDLCRSLLTCRAVQYSQAYRLCDVYNYGYIYGVAGGQTPTAEGSYYHTSKQRRKRQLLLYSDYPAYQDDFSSGQGDYRTDDDVLYAINDFGETIAIQPIDFAKFPIERDSTSLFSGADYYDYDYKIIPGQVQPREQPPIQVEPPSNYGGLQTTSTPTTTIISYPTVTTATTVPYGRLYGQPPINLYVDECMSKGPHLIWAMGFEYFATTGQCVNNGTGALAGAGSAVGTGSDTPGPDSGPDTVPDAPTVILAPTTIDDVDTYEDYVAGNDAGPTEPSCSPENIHTISRFGASFDSAEATTFVTGNAAECRTFCIFNQDDVGNEVECNSAVFGSDTFLCRLYSSTITSPSQIILDEKSIYYEKICVEDVKGLLTNCQEGLEADVQVMNSLVLVGFAEQVTTVNSLAECIQDCLKATLEPEHCLSLMYFYGETSQNCVLNRESGSTFPDLLTVKRDDEEVDYVEIDCHEDITRAAVHREVKTLPSPMQSLIHPADEWSRWTKCEKKSNMQTRYRRCQSTRPSSCERRQRRCRLDTFRRVESRTRLSQINERAYDKLATRRTHFTENPRRIVQNSKEVYSNLKPPTLATDFRLLRTLQRKRSRS